jgi:butyrate kinase
MNVQHKILAINPGSTSTKIAVFEGMKSIFHRTVNHRPEDLRPFNSIHDQYAFRKQSIINELQSSDIDISALDAVVGRGGLVKPIKSGVYEMNDTLARDLKLGIQGQHASNLGGLIAMDIAKTISGARAFIADPVVVDELDEVARVTGHPLMARRSIFHALNQKAVARLYAKSLGRAYEEINLIVAHMGGGISVGAHRAGLVVDVNNALDGLGPFSPERAGSLPSGTLVDLCFSGTITHDEARQMICGKGGLMAYFGTNQLTEVEQMAARGNTKAALVIDAMAYQTAKSIGECAAVLKGKIDGIILTGGIAHSKQVVNYIKDMVSFLGPVAVFAGEDEMQALAFNAIQALDGELEIKVYQ